MIIEISDGQTGVLSQLDTQTSKSPLKELTAQGSQNSSTIVDKLSNKKIKWRKKRTNRKYMGWIHCDSKKKKRSEGEKV